MCKIFKTDAETFSKNCVYAIKVTKTDYKSVLWIKMIDMQEKLDVKNFHDLVDKEIKRKFKTNNLTDEQIKKYKKHKHRSELNDGKKFVYAHEGIIMSVIMHCRTPESRKFKRNLVFKPHDVIICKEQMKSIKDASEQENMQTEYEN